jgi:hypothetical protein
MYLVFSVFTSVPTSLLASIKVSVFFFMVSILHRSTTDQMFCIRQILERKWEYNETVHRLFIDFK